MYQQLCSRFFDGLVPEGWLLDNVSQNWKIDKNDHFGLLLVACKDYVGNVSLWKKRNGMSLLRKIFDRF